MTKLTPTLQKNCFSHNKSQEQPSLFYTIHKQTIKTRKLYCYASNKSQEESLHTKKNFRKIFTKLPNIIIITSPKQVITIENSGECETHLANFDISYLGHTNDEPNLRTPEE